MKQGFFSALYQSSASIDYFLGNKRKFMNLGFEGVVSKEIKSEDESDRHHISLYIKLIGSALSIDTNTSNISALEIGCGRGGGCYVMKKYFNITDITAVDLSSANIRLAKRFVPEGKFFASDAITFQTDKKFDLIVNLESSHRYSSRLLFFKNVVSMMKQDASFVFGDMIRKNELQEVEKMILESGLKIAGVQSVNKEVVKSIEQNSVKQYPLATKFPRLFPRRIHSFFVTIHSRAYNRLKNEDVLYNLYLLKKN
jgi:SAM-dependent methyltransferase